MDTENLFGSFPPLYREDSPTQGLLSGMKSLTMETEEPSFVPSNILVYRGNIPENIGTCNTLGYAEIKECMVPTFPPGLRMLISKNMQQYMQLYKNEPSAGEVLWDCPCLSIEYPISPYFKLYRVQTYQSASGHFTLRDIVDTIVQFYLEPFTEEEIEDIRAHILSQAPQGTSTEEYFVDIFLPGVRLEDIVFQTATVPRQSKEAFFFERFIEGSIPRYVPMKGEIITGLEENHLSGHIYLMLTLAK
jgi:hypothetical protein